jgi:hypothetical protein
MPSQTYRVCLPPSLGQRVEELADTTGQGISATIRRCVQLALDTPELLILLHQQGPLPLVDTTTEAQRQAWADYQQRAFDPATILT